MGLISAANDSHSGGDSRGAGAAGYLCAFVHKAVRTCGRGSGGHGRAGQLISSSEVWQRCEDHLVAGLAVLVGGVWRREARLPSRRRRSDPAAADMAARQRRPRPAPPMTSTWYSTARPTLYCAEHLTIKTGDVVNFHNVSGGPHNVSFWADSIPTGAAAVLGADMPDQMQPLSGHPAHRAGRASTRSRSPGRRRATTSSTACRTSRWACRA